MVVSSSYADRVLDQVVSYRPVTAEAQVQSQASPYAISDRQRERGDRGNTVVKVLCYKSEGRWFNSRRFHWNF